MTDNTKPEALDLADWLEAVGGGGLSPNRCAALLRRQHARIAELEAELEAVGGVQALSAAPAAPTPEHIAAMERAWLWMDNQADQQSKGGHATFDLMMLREERDALRAAIDAARKAAPGVGDELRDTLVAVSAAIAERDDRAAQKMICEILAASTTPPAEQQAQPGAVYAELPQPDSWFHFTAQFWENKLRDFADRTHALRMQAAPKAVPGEPVHGDVLPPVGSRVYIRHGRDNGAHACTVTGYYAWGDLGGDKRLHRVFVRLVYEGTDTQQARMLCDCHPTAEAALSEAAPQQEAQEPVAVPRFNCWSTNEGDSWFDHPADSQAIYDCLGNDAKVGDEYELTAGWTSVTARYRITEVVGDGEEYEVECISHPHENSAPQPAPAPLSEREDVAMIDAAMVEMANIVPPLKRSECARLIRAALAAQGGKV